MYRRTVEQYVHFIIQKHELFMGLWRYIVGPPSWSPHGVFFSTLPVYGNVAVFPWESTLFFRFGCHDSTECVTRIGEHTILYNVDSVYCVGAVENDCHCL
jgi:hypothetical protein